ncbi:MAG: thiamine phosphate synthase [Planctomycetes bacterium]|nr:thiamine phosphate synthase [Planctomycetota bacterium]
MNGAEAQRTQTLRALAGARLCLLLTRELCVADPMLTLQAALRGGVDLVQVREKNMAREALVRWVRKVHHITSALGVPLIVNDFANVAIEAGAEGVHLGQEDQTVASVRALPGGARLLVGLSTHSLAQIAAVPPEVDSIGFGPLFDSSTKGIRGQGVKGLAAASAATRLPLFGIGGLNIATLPEALAHGLRRAAVSSALCTAADPQAVARQLRALLP